MGSITPGHGGEFVPPSFGAVTPAHNQVFKHSYTIHYPAHEPRQDDPHYVDFESYRKAHIATAVCPLAYTGECGGGFELHHAEVEYAMQNEIDLAWLERDYPGISDPANVGAWVESGQNLVFYCENHHRGAGGVHNATASDWQAERYVKGLITPNVSK